MHEPCSTFSAAQGMSSSLSLSAFTNHHPTSRRRTAATNNPKRSWNQHFAYRYRLNKLRFQSHLPAQKNRHLPNKICAHTKLAAKHLQRQTTILPTQLHTYVSLQQSALARYGETPAEFLCKIRDQAQIR